MRAFFDQKRGYFYFMNKRIDDRPRPSPTKRRHDMTSSRVTCPPPIPHSCTPTRSPQTISMYVLFCAVLVPMSACVLEQEELQLGSEMQSIGYGDSIDIDQAAVVYDVIERFAPTVYFHPNELYFTGNVVDYLQTVNLAGGQVLHEDDYDNFRIDQHTVSTQDWNQYGLMNGVDDMSQILANSGVPLAEQSYWLEATNTTNQAGSLVETRVYVQATADIAANTLEIQYWYFYPYNGPGDLKSAPREIVAVAIK